MLDSWLNIWKFISAQFGVPGAIIAALCAYLIWALKAERDDHKETRKRVDEVSEKRVELLKDYLKTLNEFKASLDAVVALYLKGK